MREQIARVLGFDSLMAIEFRNRLESSLDLNLPTTIVWTCPTIATLSLHLAGQMNLALGAEAAADETPAGLDAELALVDELSRDELADLLEQELENLRSLTDE